MRQPTFRVLQNAAPCPEITSVELTVQSADVVKIRIDVGGQSASIIFESLAGLRVLDEGDLTSFWAAGISSNVGWLFEIESGGWLDHESQRSDFISQHIGEQREYLVISIDRCVSVISRTQPKVEWLDVA
jgi:hypothetical protein